MSALIETKETTSQHTSTLAGVEKFFMVKNAISICVAKSIKRVGIIGIHIEASMCVKQAATFLQVIINDFCP